MPPPRCVRASAIDTNRTLGGRPRDSQEILTVQIVAAEQLKVIVAIMRVTRNQGCFSGVAAVEEHLDPRRLEHGNHLGVFRLAGNDLPNWVTLTPRPLSCLPVSSARSRP